MAKLGRSLVIQNPTLEPKMELVMSANDESRRLVEQIDRAKGRDYVIVGLFTRDPLAENQRNQFML
jgi:hypothetical protein